MLLELRRRRHDPVHGAPVDTNPKAAVRRDKTFAYEVLGARAVMVSERIDDGFRVRFFTEIFETALPSSTAPSAPTAQPSSP